MYIYDLKFSAAHRVFDAVGLEASLHGHTFTLKAVFPPVDKMVEGEAQARYNDLLREVLTDFDFATLLDRHDLALKQWLTDNGQKKVVLDGEATLRGILLSLAIRIYARLPSVAELYLSDGMGGNESWYADHTPDAEPD